MTEFKFSLVVCVCWMLQSCKSESVHVMVFPDKNYTVYYDSGQNVSYDCVVGTGDPIWEIRCLQLGCVGAQLNTDRLKYQSQLWLVVDVAANQSKLILREEAWRKRANLRIVCQSHSTDSTILRPPRSKDYYIITYGPLEDPSNLELSVDSNNTHYFSWVSPSVPQDVNLSCYVTAINLSSGVTLLNTSTNKQTIHIFNYPSRSDCSEVTFFVYCANEDDDSIRTSMSNKTENLPLSPNVSPLEQNFTVLIELKASLSLEILTKTANVCSPSYPVMSYIVNVINDQGVRNAVTFDPSDNEEGSQLAAFRLSSTDAPVLMLDQVLSISVTVCSNVTCHTTHNFTLFTAQVQNPVMIYYYSNHSVAFVCDVLQSSQATGCYFNLTTVSINGSMTSEVFTVNITSELKSQCPSEYCTISMCGVTDSLPTNYLSIDAYAIIENRTVSDFGQPVRLVNGSKMDTAGEYSNCFKIETQEPNSRARVVGGIVGGVLGLSVLIISVVAVVLFVVLIVFRKRAKSKLNESNPDELDVEYNCNRIPQSDGIKEKPDEDVEIEDTAKVKIVKVSQSGKARIKVILDEDNLVKIGKEAELLLP